MRASHDVPIGERVRFHRESQHRTQAVVAGLAGITVDYLSQIERGLRTPTIAVLHQLARVLHVRTSALLGEPAPAEEQRTGQGLREVQRAMLGLDGMSTPPELGHLRSRVDGAWRSWQSSPSRFSEVGPLLPNLVREVDAAARQPAVQPDHHRTALRIAADLFFLLRTYCKRNGRNDLALLAADRALQAARAADDTLRVGAGGWNLAHVLIADGEPSAAAEVALAAAADLDRAAEGDEATRLALVGALHLVAAIGTVRNGDSWRARNSLREEAAPLADRCGETNAFWTAFGPTNVALHRMSVELESGEAGEGIRAAGNVEIDRSPSIERRATFYLELARCHHQRREDEAVVLHLLNAERTSPEDVARSALARDLVRGLLQRARPTLLPEVGRLAGRVGLLER